ncbi:MAG TPA: hypothetical protein VMZ53_18255 [Kofleriaceae bacterium]|nr:hypothetical protein [Kofleriaceae bacterium]
MAFGCRVHFDERRDAGGPVADAAAPCVAGECSPSTTFRVTCSTGPKSADEICGSMGFGTTAVVRGYYWFQCGGTLDRCPGGWDGIDCPAWCPGGTDCVGVSLCGSAGESLVTEKTGDGSTTFDPMETGRTCMGYNPGWTVRIRCYLR